MADVQWIKLYVDMFDKRKIKKIRRLPAGNEILLIWVMLLAIAGKCNAGGMIYITESVPFTEEDLADELGFDVNTIRLATKAFEDLGMISFTKKGFLCIDGWEEHQNVDRLSELREYNRLAKQKSREKKRLTGGVKDDVNDNVNEGVNDKSMTSQRCHDTDIDIDKEKDKKNKKKTIKTYSDDPELNQAILSFIEFRKGIKKPMTDHAVELLMKKLNGMSQYIPDQIEILNQSIMNGWQGIFPLKEQGNQAQPIKQSIYKKQTKAEELDESYHMMAAWSEGNE